ncbi:hypothetical protein CLOM_g23698, partial [Closterium sp. NIES-68]
CSCAAIRSPCCGAFSAQATKLVHSYSLDELKDRRMDASEDAIVELADLALDCIKTPGIRRPEMKDVVRRLDAMIRAHAPVEEEGENDIDDLAMARSARGAGSAGNVGSAGAAGSTSVVGSADGPVSGSTSAGVTSLRNEQFSEVVAEREESKRSWVSSGAPSYMSVRECVGR